MTGIIPIERIEEKIFLIRRKKVMLDADLASIYGVTTKRLGEQVKRNSVRFPDDFMFLLTKEEKDELVANCDRLKKLKHSSSLPKAFTEHGALMLANVLKSDKSIQASIQIVRAFIHLRELLAGHKEMSVKLTQLEKKYDSQFKIVFDAIRNLMETPRLQKNRIGF